MNNLGGQLKCHSLKPCMRPHTSAPACACKAEVSPTEDAVATGNGHGFRAEGS